MFIQLSPFEGLGYLTTYRALYLWLRSQCDYFRCNSLQCCVMAVEGKEQISLERSWNACSSKKEAQMCWIYLNLNLIVIFSPDSLKYWIILMKFITDRFTDYFLYFHLLATAISLNLPEYMLIQPTHNETWVRTCHSKCRSAEDSPFRGLWLQERIPFVADNSDSFQQKWIGEGWKHGIQDIPIHYSTN